MLLEKPKSRSYTLLRSVQKGRSHTFPGKFQKSWPHILTQRVQKSRLIGLSLIIALALIVVVGFSQVKFSEQQSVWANTMNTPTTLKLEVSSGEVEAPYDHEVKIVVRDKNWKVVTSETGFINSEILVEVDEDSFYTIQFFVDPLANGTIFARIDPFHIEPSDHFERKITVTLKPLFYTEAHEDENFDQVFKRD